MIGEQPRPHQVLDKQDRVCSGEVRCGPAWGKDRGRRKMPDTSCQLLILPQGSLTVHNSLLGLHISLFFFPI